MPDNNKQRKPAGSNTVPTDSGATQAKDEKKPGTPKMPGNSKSAQTTEAKKPETPAKSADTKAAPTAGDKKPDTPAESAGPAKDTAVKPSKGIRVTQVFEDRGKKPDEAALKSLPVPQEGEGFSMRLHPGYFFEFLDHPFSINREVQDYKDLYESIKESRELLHSTASRLLRR